MCIVGFSEENPLRIELNEPDLNTFCRQKASSYLRCFVRTRNKTKTHRCISQHCFSKVHHFLCPSSHSLRPTVIEHSRGCGFVNWCESEIKQNSLNHGTTFGAKQLSLNDNKFKLTARCVPSRRLSAWPVGLSCRRKF